MIDYEKLKEITDLVYMLAKMEKSLLQVNYEHKVDHTGACNDYFCVYGSSRILDRMLPDDLIKRLKELTEPEPKYKLGDKVWIRDYEFGPVEAMVCEIDTESKEMYYENEYQEWREEKDLYPSREALIDAQIEYWSSLKKQETSTCSDDVSMECDHDGYSKCRKCGEFYR